MHALAHAFAQPDSAPPSVYACKGAVGHGLGAAGLVSAVLACMIGRAGQRPPMPWLDADGPMAEAPFPIRAQRHVVPRQGHHAVVAAGFAGHTAGVLLEQH